MAKMFAPKNEINRQEPTCTEEGWVKYGCTYESDRYATAPEHIDEWTETIPLWAMTGRTTVTPTISVTETM